MKKKKNKSEENPIIRNASLKSEMIKFYNASFLMSPRRFDLGLKLFYLNYNMRLPKLTDELYKKTIEIITSFSFKEYGNNQKNTYHHFKRDFNGLEGSIKNILKQYGQKPGSRRPWLGTLVEEYESQLCVVGLYLGAPAAAAGIETGDIILSVDSQPVSSMAGFFRTIWHFKR